MYSDTRGRAVLFKACAPLSTDSAAPRARDFSAKVICTPGLSHAQRVHTSLIGAARLSGRASGRPLGLEPRRWASSHVVDSPLQPEKKIASSRANLWAQAVRWVSVGRAVRGKWSGVRFGGRQLSREQQRANSRLRRQKSKLHCVPRVAGEWNQSQGPAEKKIHGRRAAGKLAAVIASGARKGTPGQQSPRLMGGPRGGRRAAFVREGRIKHSICVWG